VAAVPIALQSRIKKKTNKHQRCFKHSVRTRALMKHQTLLTAMKYMQSVYVPEESNAEPSWGGGDVSSEVSSFKYDATQSEIQIYAPEAIHAFSDTSLNIILTVS
jgi:hypothetical protein